MRPTNIPIKTIILVRYRIFCMMALAIVLLTECCTFCFSAGAAELPGDLAKFTTQYCVDCHSADTSEGNFDLSSLSFDLDNRDHFKTWVTVFDRVSKGEMPPEGEVQPEDNERQGFKSNLSQSLTAAERERIAKEGRSTQRRMNRFEYENTVRDLLHAPWLQLKELLPEDGEAFHFNKVGDALDMSHVQMARYLVAAEYALREVIAKQVARPETATTRYYAREQDSFVRNIIKYKSEPERIVIPILGYQSQPEIFAKKAPVSVGESDPVQRELEAFVEIASQYESYEMDFDKFKAPTAGRYKLRFKTYTVQVGPTKPEKDERWWIPDLEDVSIGKRTEPVSIYAETPPRQLRLVGKFDTLPEPTVHELDVWLLEGESIRPDCSRFYRARQGAGRFRNPNATPEGAPGIAYQWMEVEGPIFASWPSEGHRLLFGDLPVIELPGIAEPDVDSEPPLDGLKTIDVDSNAPYVDSERLLKRFMEAASRRPVQDVEVQRFLPLVHQSLKAGRTFVDSMCIAYKAILCSPEFIWLQEEPGALDEYALASRLSYFLTNAAPDQELTALANRGQLHEPAVLRSQTDRLLHSPKSAQFINAFLDYWLDLRKITGAAPDPILYGDYYLDDLLMESALEETQAFFSELVRENLPARNIVDSDFVMVNERLAKLYELPSFEGVKIRRVTLPPNSSRGGIMTQASVLKVTADGISTSPVLRGAWIMERIVGKPSLPPPKNVAVIEPDTRGTTTIRQQLDKHREVDTCAFCHKDIDPPGFAMESFDVAGGWRERYRATNDNKDQAEPGIGHGGQALLFHYALPVDPSGVLPDGRSFADVREFKQLLLADESQIARNLVQQLLVYATGTPMLFSDRQAVENILDRARDSEFGTRTLIHELIQSELFRSK